MTTDTRHDLDLRLIRWFSDLGTNDVADVGGKNASLGEMLSALADKGIRVPDGFAVTAHAYRQFIADNELESRIRDILDDYHAGKQTLPDAGTAIREMIGAGEFSDELRDEVGRAYRELCDEYDTDEVDVAVRSSATAEDLPHASFAGQQETYLNVRGEDNLLHAVRRCFASLFTDRAIAYREEHGFDHLDVYLSVGVQKMVRSDTGASGVMFTVDTENGFPHIIIINAAFGLGENVVKGSISPDEYRVFKPALASGAVRPILSKHRGEKKKKLVYARGKRGKRPGDTTTKNIDTTPEERQQIVLDDEAIVQLATWAVQIETHYQRPMDIEWALDGETQELFVVQARPETVQSQHEAGMLKTYELKVRAEPQITGLAIGHAIAAGKARVLKTLDGADAFESGEILVTRMTDPDWVPVMKRASAIVTDLGGRTSHAAIVSRELGVPAVIGTGQATQTLSTGDELTVDCTRGETGNVYPGILEFEAREIDVSDVPETRTQIMLNIASPEGALRWWKLPADGIGLARMEFVINHEIQAHPMALVNFDALDDEGAKQRIAALTAGFASKTEFFVERLAEGIARIAASRYPQPVIVRTSDFKTNEYAELIGGAPFERQENNPMLGFRGASRYTDERYEAAFALECAALKRAREDMGLENIVPMIPFCRTLDEADRVLKTMAENGLKRGDHGLQIYMMAEIPSNLLLAAQFAKRFDGFSIGSNDLTQLILGIDRDSALLAEQFDERNEAVMQAIFNLIKDAHNAGIKVGICGQAPSDHPDFAEFLVRCGIDSISVDPDSVIAVRQRVADTERKLQTKTHVRRKAQ